MVKVSVVIPVYNVEEYLRECLDTIVNQTLKDIEIICVNDGSTDKSLDILKEYADKDDRMTVLSQENCGHAVATNRGIDLAKGEYLFLMDSDDMLKLNALEDTYNIAQQKNVDFVLFRALNYNDKEDKTYKAENYSMNRLARKVGDNIFNYKDIGDLIFKITVTPWSKLYKRDFIEENHVRFPEGLVFDDNVFFWKALFSAERIYFYKEYLFMRRWYPTSSTTAGNQHFIDSIAIYNLVWDVFKEYDLFGKYKVTLYNNKMFLAYMRFSKIKEEFKEDYYNTMREDFMKIFNDKELYRDMMKNIEPKYKKMFELVLISDTSEEFILSKEYCQMKNSLSWNITKPLRKINTLTRKAKNKL
ncbi:glycosyltransferase family 2 protein [Candidatus Methanosphaera massiliense]|jgi:glycosyltransferase involved in cell wall biosynthesis|uniref:glycosyltransferase family 2 protein n=1 Tax=Methanosphaera TaxID=2316 RepID=UPI0023800B97|nr:glycosyltransferase family 2 protein [Candidatus Methanosphaera massiliense]MDD6286393.1 glycosyltransferase family 2 protein [Methanobacteriaceae archaeon]MDE4078781.1 glycosyltransferase family 2 protein [Candidatus Methanosphaera massiliense]MDY2745578.1 glycosyltransferase family 2 protein [Methanosphaera sp.]